MIQYLAKCHNRTTEIIQDDFLPVGLGSIVDKVLSVEALSSKINGRRVPATSL